MENTADISKTVEFLKGKGITTADIVIISGSGQGWLAELVSDDISIPYSDIPLLPNSAVKGHANILHSGKFSGMKILLFEGRFHLYEGFSAEEVTRPVRISARLGIRHMLILNAAGAINRKYHETDLMIIRDHINMTGINPLAGYRGEGKRFISMNDAYSRSMALLMKDAARNERIGIHEGVYAAMPGPSYETPAEIQMLRIFGADAVGMSTVPEVIVARQEGIDVLGLSVITNTLKPSGKPPSHEDVLANAGQAAEKTAKVIRGFLEKMSAVSRKRP
jgi:purine-nucleoside phosphorylase